MKVQYIFPAGTYDSGFVNSFGTGSMDSAASLQSVMSDPGQSHLFPGMINQPQIVSIVKKYVGKSLRKTMYKIAPTAYLYNPT